MKILKTSLESLIEAEIVFLECRAKSLAEESARLYIRADELKKECGIPLDNKKKER